MKKYMAAFAGLTLASACAQSPDSISPIPLGNAFASTSCRDANSMLVAERSNLSSLSAAQRNAVAGDAFGVLLIGVPVSSLAGADREGDIGVSKGKILALEERVRSC